MFIIRREIADEIPREVPKDPLGAEYLLLIVIGRMIHEGKLNEKVLCTEDVWSGMIYKEDVKVVKRNFRTMLQEGRYREDLFSDL